MHIVEPHSEDCVSGYFRFALPIHRVDSRTLGVSLIETGNLLQSIVRNIDAESEVAIRIEAFRPGSFEVAFELHMIAMSAIQAAQPVIPFLKQSFETMVEFIKLKQVLKGEKLKRTAKTGDRIKVTGDNNTVTVVSADTVNLYIQRPQAHEAVEKQFSCLREDENIEDFEVFDDVHESKLLVSRDDFASLTRTAGASGVSQDDTIEEQQLTFVVTKPVLEGKPAMWQFMDESGSKVSAKMLDQDFVRLVQEGEPFAAGDRLRVHVRIVKSYDENLGLHTIKNREILRVHEHRSKPQQLGMSYGTDV